MNLNAVIEQVGRDRGIERAVLVETLEAALKTAAKKVFGEQRDIDVASVAALKAIESLSGREGVTSRRD